MKDTIPTPEQVRAYLDTDGGRCPFCESAHISESGPTEDAGSVLVVGMRCADCGTHWGATYHLDAVWPDGADEAIYPPDAQAERIAALEQLLRDVQHQITTDSDLDTVTAASKYRSLSETITAALIP